MLRFWLPAENPRNRIKFVCVWNGGAYHTLLIIKVLVSDLGRTKGPVSSDVKDEGTKWTESDVWL